MKRTFARMVAAPVGALGLLAGAAMADDLDFYLDWFEPLPALPPIPADNSMTP